MRSSSRSDGIPRLLIAWRSIASTDVNIVDIKGLILHYLTCSLLKGDAGESVRVQSTFQTADTPID